MENLSDATAIVEQMLLRYFNASEEERGYLTGAEKAQKAWLLIRQTLESQDMLDLADKFEQHPHETQRDLVYTLTKLMNEYPDFASQLNQLYDYYLKEMYEGNLQIQQDFGQISNIAGATKGGTIIGVDFDHLEEKRSED
jgi:flagellar biosynthesis chaperone FliJ